MTIDLRINGINDYTLLRDISVTSYGWSITVMEGFRYDGASIPKNAYEEIGCPIDFAFEACIHDALYRSKLIDRKIADKIFHNLLVRNGVDSFKAKIMYLALRAMGGDAYNNATDISHARNYVIITHK